MNQTNIDFNGNIHGHADELEKMLKKMDYSGDTPQVTPQVEHLLLLLEGEKSRKELQGKLDLSDRKSFVQNYIEPAMEAGLIEYTIPEKPNSRLQKYRLTEKGKAYKKKLKK